MPHYLFETRPLGVSQPDAVIELAAERFTELVLEHRDTAYDGRGRDVEIVRAPGVGHLHRWSTAAHLRLRTASTVEADTPGAGRGHVRSFDPTPRREE